MTIFIKPNRKIWIMDLSLFLLLLVPVGLALWLPLIGKMWSAVTAYLIFGLIFGFSLSGYFLLSDTPGGSDLQFAQLSLWIAIHAVAMILMTFLVYRYRKRKKLAS